MTPGISNKYKNMPLAAYREQVRRTKRFLIRFYSPGRLPKPATTRLVAALAFWATGLCLALLYDTPGQRDNQEGFPVNLMVVTTTLSLMGTCFSYLQSRKRNKQGQVPGTGTGCSSRPG